MRFNTTYVANPIQPARKAGMILEDHLLTARTLAADDMIRPTRRYIFMASQRTIEGRGCRPFGLSAV